MLTITKLRYALAVRAHGHFRKAAESCFVTQSTLSIGVASLEHLIGFKLFIREVHHGRATSYAGVTKQGQAFLDKAAKVVVDFDELTRGNEK